MQPALEYPLVRGTTSHPGKNLDLPIWTMPETSAPNVAGCAYDRPHIPSLVSTSRF
jgi:hypothetical protein